MADTKAAFLKSRHAAEARLKEMLGPPCSADAVEPKAESWQSKSADELWASAIIEHFKGHQAGKPFEGLELFQASLQLDPSSGERHYFVACLLFMLARNEEALAGFEAAIEANPNDSDAYLDLVLALEQLQRLDEARLVARRAVEARARWASEWQRTPIFVPGLTSLPWWQSSQFPWIEALEAAFNDIKAEVDALVHGHPDFDGNEASASMPKTWPAVGGPRATHDATIIAAGGEWREFIVFGSAADSAQEEVAQRCLPKLRSLLEDLIPEALAMARLGAGEIILSALAPGTRLVPHCASNNIRLTCHLGLVCPAGARLRVGPTWGSWEEGKCIVFDDSFEHEVVHDGEGVRMVLLIRFWHPELSRDKWLPTLDAGFADFERLQRKRITPPMSPEVVSIVQEPLKQLSAEHPQHAAHAEKEATCKDSSKVLGVDAPALGISRALA